jgi:hypothetical protein
MRCDELAQCRQQSNAGKKNGALDCSTAPMKVQRGHRQQTEGVGEA